MSFSLYWQNRISYAFIIPQSLKRWALPISPTESKSYLLLKKTGTSSTRNHQLPIAPQAGMEPGEALPDWLPWPYTGLTHNVTATTELKCTIWATCIGLFSALLFLGGGHKAGVDLEDREVNVIGVLYVKSQIFNKNIILAKMYNMPVMCRRCSLTAVLDS